MGLLGNVYRRVGRTGLRHVVSEAICNAIHWSDGSVLP